MMFDIQITERIKEHCVNEVKKYNFGKRGHSNGTPEQQLRGIVAQSVVQDECGFPLIDGSAGFDGGEDMKIGDYVCDIKTMKRKVTPKRHYVGNFPKCQISYKTDVYIFTSTNVNNNILTVVGWIPKDEFLKKANIFQGGVMRGRTDGTEYKTPYENYEIEYKYLRVVYDSDHMMNQIYMAWKPKQGEKHGK